MTIRNSLITKNHALNSGGGVYASALFDIRLSLLNSSIVENSADGVGGSIYKGGGGMMGTISNSVIWNNSPGKIVLAH